MPPFSPSPHKRKRISHRYEMASLDAKCTVRTGVIMLNGTEIYDNLRFYIFVTPKIRAPRKQ